MVFENEEKSTNTLFIALFLRAMKYTDQVLYLNVNYMINGVHCKYYVMVVKYSMIRYLFVDHSSLFDCFPQNKVHTDQKTGFPRFLIWARAIEIRPSSIVRNVFS